MVSYKRTSEFPGWMMAEQHLISLLSRYPSNSVLEVGSGANPTLSPDEIERCGVSYTTSDISIEELDKADQVYHRLVFDFCESDVPAGEVGKYDFIWSRMVNEHIPDPRRYYQNLWKMLRPNGIMAHCFATLYGLPFILNRALPSSLSDFLLNMTYPRDRHHHGKFPAFYRWCRGPTSGMIEKLAQTGFKVEEYVGYFGHRYYENNRLLWPFKKMEQVKTSVLMKIPCPYLTSYAGIVARRAT